MESFSTYDLPADQKAASWSEIASNDLDRVDITARNPADFDGWFKRASLGPILLTDVCGSSVQFRYTPRNVSRLSDSSYLLFMPQDGGFELSLNGKYGVWVNRSELCLVDLALPYELGHDDRVNTLCLRFPRRYLESSLPRAAHLTGQVITSDLAAARILQSFLRELVREITQSSAAELPFSCYQGMLNLIAGAYAGCTDEPVDRGIKARARAFRDFIDRYLTNPNLRQADVDRRFGVSDRYVRAAMREGGAGFVSYVLDRRLEKSRQLLRDPELRSTTITEISFRAGFNSAWCRRADASCARPAQPARNARKHAFSEGCLGQRTVV
jgi:AraC-like DNA-binding protein